MRARLTIVAALLPLIAVAGHSGQEAYNAKWGLPGSPTGAAAGIIAEAISRGDDDFTRQMFADHFDPEFVAAQPMGQHLRIFRQLHEELPDLQVMGAERTPDGATITMGSVSTDRRFRLALEVGDTGRVTSLGIEPVESAVSGDPITDLDELDRQIREWVSENQFSGVVVHAPGGETTFQRAYGYADKRSGVENTVDTRFNIGSLNKLFTGAAIMLLVGSGDVDIDAPMSDYLNGFPGEIGDRVTVRHLLRHRSGWSHYWDNEVFLSRLGRLRTLDD